MRTAIEQDTLAALAETGAARKFRVLRGGVARCSRSGCKEWRQCISDTPTIAAPTQPVAASANENTLP
ncbi:hypothetical protein DWF74_15940 [Pseudomonas protegens]|nr:hypothetical protein DWF74_15940 [Pseudomonas protegens]